MIDRNRGYGESDRYKESVEREKRRRDFDAAIASVALEGLLVPESYKEEAERFIRGEIDIDALTRRVHELARLR